MTDQRQRRAKLQAVEQLTVINDEIEPIAQRVHGIFIARRGARRPRRIDRARLRQTRDKRTVGRETPRPVQIDERRAVAENFDFGLDPVLPQPDATLSRRCHDWLRRLRTRRPWRPPDAPRAGAAATNGLRTRPTSAPGPAAPRERTGRYCACTARSSSSRSATAPAGGRRATASSIP